MTQEEKILSDLYERKISVEDALLSLKKKPLIDLGFAQIDTHRRIRQGNTEVIYAQGKTSKEISSILKAMDEAGEKNILITRLDKEKAEEVKKESKIKYFEEAKIGLLGEEKEPDGKGTVLIVTAGTSDIPIAKEAEITCRVLGNKCETLFDVGVAGLHRILSKLDTLMRASVIIVIAGMDGALASVVGGLVSCPVIAVPTDTGYGSSFGGLSSLLSMLNSCAAGIGVMNINNGFGAAVHASRINHLKF